MNINMSLNIYVLVLLIIVVVLCTFIIKLKKYITQLKSEVDEYERNAHIIIDGLSDAVVVVDMTGMIHRVNPTTEKMLGAKSESYEGRNIAEIISMYDNYNGMLCSNPVQEILSDSSLKNKRTVLSLSDSKMITVDMSVELISSRVGEQKWLVLVMKDLTEHNKVNEYLLQVQRLEALELTSRGCAHDINNMLGGVICMSEVVLRKLDDKSELREYITRIIENCDRAANTVKKLQAVARNTGDFFENVDIHLLLTKLVKSNDVFCMFSLSLNASNSIVCINSARIELALTNILLNAVEAVRGREPRLTICTDKVTLDAEFCKDNELIQGSQGFIRIKIKDNGCGMSKELQETIFDSLASTSNSQRGSAGIGLNTVNRIVHENKGCVFVESEQGEWSIFTIYLPLQSSGDQNTS